VKLALANCQDHCSWCKQAEHMSRTIRELPAYKGRMKKSGIDVLADS
jgi:hypothetical protein